MLLSRIFSRQALLLNAAPYTLTIPTALARSFGATLTSPAFSVRLSNNTALVCNSSTPGLSGFIDSYIADAESHMFFWLFDSKNKPLSDPLILWMSGGPGASSTGYGNLMELGPCRIAPEGGYTIENEFGWNTNATVLFVDQPVSVGFSTGSKKPNGLSEASRAMHTFLRQFLTAFPHLQDVDFYIAGESYDGSWVPALATEILHDHPAGDVGDALREDSRQSPLSTDEYNLESPIHLKGVMIGNGLVRQPVQMPGTFEALCSGPEGIFNSSHCLEWTPRALWCEKSLAVCEAVGWTSSACRDAQGRCSEMAGVAITGMHRNPYDWRRVCDDDPLGCYPELAFIEKYLNDSEVKKALGVHEEVPFVGVSLDVFKIWEETGDLWKTSAGYVNFLLDKGIRVLIYVGDKDLYCNAAGMRRLVYEGLEWDGHPFFRFREYLPWYHDTSLAGRWKSYSALTYAEIFDSGHLAPFDLPAETLSLISGWILNAQPPVR